MARWWPDWKNPLIWLLGLTFGSNNSRLLRRQRLPAGPVSRAKAAPIWSAPALGWLNGGQFAASFALLLVARSLQQRALPYLIFGPLTLVAFIGMVTMSGYLDRVLGGGRWALPPPSPSR